MSANVTCMHIEVSGSTAQRALAFLPLHVLFSLSGLPVTSPPLLLNSCLSLKTQHLRAKHSLRMIIWRTEGGWGGVRRREKMFMIKPYVSCNPKSLCICILYLYPYIYTYYSLCVYMQRWLLLMVVLSRW